jgi:5'-nucleotidase
MTFLLTNDDGIDAPGLQALQQVVADEGVVVAPDTQYSGCGHAVTTNRPIRVESRSPSAPAMAAYAISGTPADCVRLGLTHLYPDARLVLSGINAGGNLGADVYVSGTVAAVREAALLGIPGIAISHYRQRDREIDWQLAAQMTAKVLAELLARPLPAAHYWNVNLPHLPPHSPLPDIVFCSPCRQPLPVRYRIDGDTYHYSGIYSERSRDPGADVEICFAGKIAITLLQL